MQTRKLTVQEFAEATGLTQRQVYYYILMKRIKAQKVSDIYLINPSQIDKVTK